MRKILLFCVFIFFPLTVGATAVTYEDAVEMALSDLQALRDIDAALRGIQSQRDELSEDIQRMERGVFPNDSVTALYENLWSLESGLMSAIEVMHETERELEELLLTMTSAEEINMENFITELQELIDKMLFAQSQRQNIASIHAQRFGIFNELDQFDTRTQDILANARHALAETDRQIENLRLQRAQTALLTENILRNTIITISEQNLSIEALEAEIVLSEENLRRVTVLHEHGRASANELRAARFSLEQNRLQLLELSRNSENLRQNLNLLLGREISEISVEFEDFAEFPEDIERYISETTARSPQILQAQLEIDRARAELDFFISRLPTNRTREEREADDETIAGLQETYDRAVSVHAQAVLSMETAMLQAFNELENLHTRVEARQIELENAQSHLQTTLTRLQMGQVTQYDVSNAELAVQRAEQNIQRMLYQKWLLIFRLQNPSLL